MSPGMGPPPKPPGQRKRRNKRPTLSVIDGGASSAAAATDPEPSKGVPSAPDGLRPATVARWVLYWCSDVSKLVDRDVDLTAIERLFQLYDARARDLATIEKEGAVAVGSQGQPVRHPLARAVLEYGTEIGRLEDRFGVSPRGRLQLGLTVGAGPSTPEGLSAALLGGLKVDPRSKGADPRSEGIKPKTKGEPMGMLRWGDNSMWGVIHKRSKKSGRYYWIIASETGRPRALMSFGGHKGFATKDESRADAREVVEGLGAKYQDLTETEG